jgi:iron complex outermembrane receptor protein
VQTGAIRHELTFGATGMIRTDRFGDYVYDYAGYSNYHHNRVTEPAPGNPKTGPVYDRRNDSERSLVVNDIMTLSPQWTVEAGLRRVQVQRDRSIATGTSSTFVLPSLAVTWKPSTAWMVYGQIAHGMEHGGTADMGTVNELETLPPGRSRQVEFGAKGTAAGQTVSAALFQIEQGLEYIDAGNRFVRNGTRTHRGIEVAAQGALARDLTYSLSLMGLDPNQSGTGDAAIDGKYVANVPRVKSVAQVEYAVPQVQGLRVRGVWQASGRKAFDTQNTVFVPGYSVYGLAATYDARIGATSVTLRAAVDNVTNKFYWRDVTPLLGGYLFPGAPRTARVTAQFDF